MKIVILANTFFVDILEIYRKDLEDTIKKAVLPGSKFYIFEDKFKSEKYNPNLRSGPELKANKPCLS
jgi:hypothetical protein